MKNKLIILAIILSVYLIFSLSKSILELNQSGQTIVDYEKELEIEVKKNQELKKRLADLKKPEFIEREAREKLGMGRLGESIIIMPPITISPVKKQEARELENWEKWWKLLF